MKKKVTAATIDPTQITSASEIPPSGAEFAGPSPAGLVDVYYGTIAGDVDAQPSARELLGTSPDTGGLSNADYIYTQVSKLYGQVDLPSFESPSGDSVKALIFVSGSTQGSYGAFHFSGAQADFDRIVVDSLDASGSYSANSTLASAASHLAVKKPHLFPMYRGASDLLGILSAGDHRLRGVKPAALRKALGFAEQSISALRTALKTRNPSATPRPPRKQVVRHSQGKGEIADLTRRLILANQSLAGLADAALAASGGRQYLSTALFAAEIVESFETLTSKGNPGKTDGESVSRVLAFKLAPELALVAGFNSSVTQQWWADGHPDYVNDNSQTDQSTDGNGAGVIFLEFLTDYLGVPVDQILQSTPTSNGAALGQTYTNLLSNHPELQLDQVAGSTGTTAFTKMVALLQQNTQASDGTLNLPADGNPFPSMSGSKQGGLFAAGSNTVSPPPNSGPGAQDGQSALQRKTQPKQVAALKATPRQVAPKRRKTRRRPS